MTVLTSPARALAQRHLIEVDTLALLMPAVEAFLDDTIVEAKQALTAPVLLAAGQRKRDPFAYTNVLSRWRQTVRTLAAEREDLFPSQIENLLAEADLPKRVFDDTSALLIRSREEGWSDWRTKRELSRALIPKEATGTSSSSREHADYKARIRTIARTAATANFNAVQTSNLAGHAGEFPFTRWVARHDRLTRHAHLEADGQTVPTGTEFVVGGYSMAYPGDTSAPIGLTANCRCVVVGVRSTISMQAGATLSDMTVIDMLTSTAPVAPCVPCGQMAETPPPTPAPSGQGTVETPSSSGASWEGCIVVEGEMTGDGRLIEKEALRWDLPLPLRYVSSDVGAHDGAVVVGRITSIERQPNGQLIGKGDFDLGSPEGVEAHRQVDENLTNGISVDLDDVSFEVRVRADLLEGGMEDGEDLPTDDEGRAILLEINSDDEVRVTTSARIRAATIVAIPAFASAQIHTTADEGTDAGEEDESDEEQPASLAASAVTALDAYRPPAAWFENPNFNRVMPLTVTEDGRVFGHLAGWNTCHTSHTAQGQCVLAPKSGSNYAYFNTGSMLTREGTEVDVGRITMGTLHAGERLSPNATIAHYEDTGTVAAYVRAGEDQYGIWVAGVMAPGTTEEDRVRLRATPLSGDWRRIRGGFELMAALAVNVPGFPVPRPKGFVASGMMISLVAAGMVAPTQVLPPTHSDALSMDDLRYLKRIAEREKQNDTKAARSLDRRVAASALAMRVQKAKV